MARWKQEAQFVLKIQKAETEYMYQNDDDHSMQESHDAFVNKWGFSDLDISDLDRAIAMFILPRLSYFITKTDSIPNALLKTDEDRNILNEAEAFQEWRQILHTICDGMHLYLTKDSTQFTAEDLALWHRSKQYLSAYFEHLWY